MAWKNTKVCGCVHSTFRTTRQERDGKPIVLYESALGFASDGRTHKRRCERSSYKDIVQFSVQEEILHHLMKTSTNCTISNKLNLKTMCGSHCHDGKPMSFRFHLSEKKLMKPKHTYDKWSLSHFSEQKISDMTCKISWTSGRNFRLKGSQSVWVH